MEYAIKSTASFQIKFSATQINLTKINIVLSFCRIVINVCHQDLKVNKKYKMINNTLRVGGRYATGLRILPSYIQTHCFNHQHSAKFCCYRYQLQWHNMTNHCGRYYINRHCNHRTLRGSIAKKPVKYRVKFHLSSLPFLLLCCRCFLRFSWTFYPMARRH